MVSGELQVPFGVAGTKRWTDVGLGAVATCKCTMLHVENGRWKMKDGDDVMFANVLLTMLLAE